MERRVYDKLIHLNGLMLFKIIIDQHYKLSHPEIDDEIILDLVSALNGLVVEPEATRGIFEYFKFEPVYRNAKPYRLVFLICQSENYLGVINAFRVGERK